MSVTTAPNVGSDVERIDGVDKVTGRARYAFEHPIADAVYVAAVQSTIARGTVLEVQTARALAEPGVLAVLDHTNAERLHVDEDTDPDLLLLQTPEVVHRGQIIAAVVATTLEAAREAATLVGVRYDEAPHDVALSAEHPRLHVPDTVNAGVPGHFEQGDVDAALADAAYAVHATYTTAIDHHQPMEPHATIAVAEHDGLTLYNADQSPFFTGRGIAALFGLDPGQVRVIAEHIGGGFGSKALARPQVVLASLAARALGRPAKLSFTRQQMFSLVTHRPPTIQRITLGAGSDGRLTAIEHEALTHTSRRSTYVDQIGASTLHVYGSPNRRVVHRVVELDVPSPGFMRAPGHASGMFALEVAIDELAYRIGIDPIELRVRNDVARDPETGLEFSSRSLVECLREGAERFDWSRRDPQPATRREGRWLVGTGVAAAHHPDYTMGSVAHARARDDGRYEIEIAAVDIGTGARTALLLLAADALGVERERIDLRIGDSASGNATFAGGSMGTASWGWAVDKACQELKRQIADHDGTVPPGGLEVTADTATDLEQREPLARHTFGAHFAQVRVDAATGEIRADRMLAVFAAGRIISARTARSQFYGAMVMALSQALLERGEIDPRHGDFANHDLASYHFASNADIPRLDVHWLAEEDRSPNPVGGKGIGELGITGGAAAIANAVFHATGHRFRDIPIRIEDVRQALPAR
jgi:xanthine dehydrogenase YagR molybdenum-binding subunit